MILLAIRMAIATMIVSCVIGAIRDRTNRYQNSTQNFDIFLGEVSIKILYAWVIFCSICAFGAMTIPPEMSAGTPESDFRVGLAFLVLGIPGLILIPIAKKRISVRGNKIRVKNVLSSQTYDFSEITHYTSRSITTVYSGKKALFSFDRDRIGAKNMIERLQLEGIPKVENKIKDPDAGAWIDSENVNRTIKKKDVLAIKNNSSIITLCAIFVILGLAGMLIMLQFGLVMFAITFLVAGLIYLCYPLRYYHYMSNMEKALGINIDDEMAKRGICSFAGNDDDMWFFEHCDPHMIILNRDYIQEILELSKGSAGYDDLLFMGIDGKKVKIKISYREKFADWYGIPSEDRKILNCAYWFRKYITKEKTSGVIYDRETRLQIKEDTAEEDQLIEAFTETEEEADLRIEEEMKRIGMTEEQIRSVIESRMHHRNKRW